MLTAVVMCVAVVVVGLAEGQPRWNRRSDENIPDCVGIYSSPSFTRSNSLCHDRAICADVWDTIRDWNNGTRCRDRRIMYNCLCPGYEACPVGNPDHVLYANQKQSQYLCQPACELERCRTRNRPAKELVRYRDRRIFPYYRMNCRCGDHHQPLPTGGRRGLNRATKYYRVYMDYAAGETRTQYSCKSILEEEFDPCMQ